MNSIENAQTMHFHYLIHPHSSIMQKRNRVGAVWIALGAVSAALGVILGSIGAHGLEKMIAGMDDLPKRLANWDTAVRYQMYHSLGLSLVGILICLFGPSRLFTVAGWLFLTGILIFCGCLYIWVLADSTPVVVIVPVGGVAFILGWSCIAIGTLTRWRSE